jgi:prolyl oligopeptidase
MARFPVSLLFVVLIGWTTMSNSAQPQANTAGEKLHALFRAEWEWSLENSPTWASQLGDLRYNDRWPDVSLSAMEERNAHRREVLAQLDRIDRDALSEADTINYRLFRREYELRVEAHPYRWHLLPLTQLNGIQDASSLADALSFRTTRDYEDWIARLRAFPVYMDQTIALMREGIKSRMVHPKVAMQRVPPQIERQIVEDPAESLFFKPFGTFAESIEPRERKQLAEKAQQAIRTEVVPAYRRMLEFFNEEYLPACFDEVGIWQMPRGNELYALQARQFTTTRLTPEAIHEIGLKEVKRIRGEMDKVLRQVKWKGTFHEFLEHLRTDPKFYYQDGEDLLRACRAVCKQIDPGLVKLFRTLPRVPYGVEPIPMHLAPDTTAAYYRSPSADGSRAGTYFVNLYQPESRPKYEIEVLSAHEAVPGHHLQIALAMELDDLPEFRRYGGYTAYVEGWALYSEGLGEEIGLYQDPYSKFGQLTYEMWRAVRLVVDTGIHHFRWTRQQAIDYFLENTAKTQLDVENEVDRYITWPGQALSYKIGELKIRQLRARAEHELGAKFDVRDFHDAVLASGAVTLDVLESNVEAWIAARRQSE